MCKYRNLLSNCQFFANFSEEILSQIAFFCTIIRLRIKKIDILRLPHLSIK